MLEEEMKVAFSNNLKHLRTNKHLTQEQLGDALGYSDKSVSKWELGYVVPDIFVLQRIAVYFGITLNDLFDQKTRINFGKRAKISLIIWASFFVVLFLASLVYFVLTAFTKAQNCYLVYVYSLSVQAIVSLCLTSIFFGYKQVLLSISALVWSLALALYLTFLSKVYWQFFLMAAIVQVLIILIGVIIYMFIIPKTPTKQ